MYFKVAAKNVKKSFKDYSVYFLTLTLAVCIFYSFNSLSAQKVMFDLSKKGTAEVIETLSEGISYISILVSIILGGLILYANNFLIKRRNKEFGLYMMLGMSRSKISGILMCETIIVGVLSLACGLIIGLFLSQVLSLVVVKLFEFDMTSYRFIFSLPAVGRTALYFSIMFVLVMIFNVLIISKYKIIDLLKSSVKNEKVRFKHPLIFIAGLIVSIVCIITAYKKVLVLKRAELISTDIVLPIILGVLGTFIFFFSITGAAFYILKRCRSVYFKKLNIFTVKQISSKINTNFISMSVICLMLFVTITALCTGLGFKNALESGTKEANPYDASIYININEEDKCHDVRESLKKLGIKISSEDKTAYFNKYQGDMKISYLIGNDKDDKKLEDNATFIKISDYNNLRKLRNEKPVTLLNDEILMTANTARTLPQVEKYMKNNSTVKLEGKVYKIKNKKVVEENFTDEYAKNNYFTIIINDKFCEGKRIASSNLNINFVKDREKNEKSIEQKVKSFIDTASDPEFEQIGFVKMTTRSRNSQTNKTGTSTILFVIIYLGIIFLISSMAVIALQQLCEASDSIERYQSLKKIGADKKSIYKTIFKQVLIYFSMPVLLALIHSVVGIKVANSFIAMYNKPDIMVPSLMTALVFMIIYVLYFYAAYNGYKNIVKSKIE